MFPSAEEFVPTSTITMLRLTPRRSQIWPIFKRFHKQTTTEILQNVKQRELEIIGRSEKNFKPVINNGNPTKIKSEMVLNNSKLKATKIAETEKEFPIAPIHEIRRLTSVNAVTSFCHACREIDREDIFDLVWNKYLWYRSQFESVAFGDENLYYALLALTADKGQLYHLEQIWRQMRTDRVEPSNENFAHAFQLVGRLGHCEMEFFEQIKQEFQVSPIEADNLFENCHFERNVHYERLEKGLKIIFPDIQLKQSSKFDPKPYLSELVENLNARDTSRLAASFNSEDWKSKFSQQYESERKGNFCVKSILPSEKTSAEEIEKVNELMNTLIAEWRQKLYSGLNERINNQLRIKTFSSKNSPMTLYPFFKALDISTYVDIILDDVMKLLKMSEQYSPTLANLQRNLGLAVLNEFQKKKLTHPDYATMLQEVYESYMEWFKNPTSAWCHREAIMKAASEHKVSWECVAIDWPYPLRLGIGRELVNAIMHHLSIDLDKEGRLLIGQESVTVNDGKLDVKPVDRINAIANSTPAFFKLFRIRKNVKHQTEAIKALPLIQKLFALDKFSELEFHSTEMPMIVPPIPWTSPKHGGYLLQPSIFVRQPMQGRIQTFVNAQEKSKEIGDQKLFPVMDSLNQLGTTPWKVNKQLLNIAIKVFVNQRSYSEHLSKLGIPFAQDQLEKPKIDPEVKAKLESGEDFSGELKHVYELFVTEKHAFAQFKGECYSLWCDTLYRLSIANHVRDEEAIFFPHNLDFRGRVYPIAPYFNHMGGDLARSLLVFAQGKELGPDGLEWLKLHAVNLTGTMKREPIEKRLQWVNENLDLLIDSAENPFDGYKWWLDSDDPWQTLSTCIELKSALECEDPSKFVSHLPIHQDGSCNGLQHYAALGRDTLGATSVNLLPSDRPQDVYSEIAVIVDRKRDNDALKGSDIAKALEGFVERKVLKQTVMTTVYGVTKYGAKLQIARKLKDMDNFPLDNVSDGSKYLAQKTFESLNENFRSSQEIQAWLIECSNALTVALKRPVDWETPLGFFVTQPYIKRVKKAHINKSDELCSVDPFITHELEGTFSSPNPTKQRNGFPPNFIHSLDSTHMMLTSLNMWNEGQVFASVHDCYWTHASSVPVMNRICREQFVAMHQSPILERLSEHFSQHLQRKMDLMSHLSAAKCDMVFKSLPEKGDFDLEEVKKSVYFFS